MAGVPGTVPVKLINFPGPEGNMIPIEQLRNVRLFEEMTDDELGRIDAVLVKKPFSRGQAIVQEGHAADSLYFVHTGAVRVTRWFGESELTVATLHPFDHFGEMALIDDHPHSATVVSDEDSDILIMSKENLHRLLAGSDAFRAKYWQAIAKELTRRIRTTTNTVRDYVGINKALCENDKFREFYILCNSH